MNIRGQTGFNNAKQVQVEKFLSKENLDILNLQEINCDENTFESCDFVTAHYNLISNNAPNKYGTATLVKSNFLPENILYDLNGRIIVFNIGSITISNLYLPSGTDGVSKNSRENYLSVTLPQMLLNRKDYGIIGGDFN